MKKIVSIILASLLLLGLVTSCNQDDAGVFKTISEATKKSTITCLSYLGEDSNNIHYLITANKGLVSFKLVDGNATVPETIASQFSNDIDCCLVDTTIYVKDAYGDLYTIELNNQNKSTKIEDNPYLCITKNGKAIKKDSSVYNLKTGLDLGITGVEKHLADQNNDYFFTDTKLFKENIEINLGSEVLNNIVLFCGDYVVIKNSNKYEIHKIESNTIGASLKELTTQPTAAYSDGSKALFTTSAGVEIFDGSNIKVVESPWKNLKITDFIEIDNNLCGINSEGNLMILHIDSNELVTITPLFTK